MRVAIVSDIIPGNIGGVERFTVSISEELKKRNIEVDTYDRSAIDNWQEKWYDKYFINQRRNLQIGKATGRKIAASHVDTDVIIQNSIAGWNLRQMTNIPRIVIHHGTMRGLYYIHLPPDISRQMKLSRYVGLIRMKGGVEQYTANGATSVAVSSAVAEELRQYYTGINPVVIPNGIDTRHFAKRERTYCRQKYGIEMDEFIVCFTARFGVLGKGFEELHELAKLAWKEQLRIRFLIATDEIPPGWPDNVLFVKNVSYQELPELYSAADIFVFPTRYEGCSYSLLEAMACELPVLTTRVGYAKDLYRDINEIAPFIFEKNSTEEYWKMLKQLVNKPIFLRKLGVVGAEYVRRHNSLDIMVDSYVKLITKVTKKEIPLPL
ncbi:GDP-mannose-dependent alpha-(1-6)-phosphatidylinositol monomannoside mannosyltransferase [Sporomusa ovata DSM 2662]|uniref:Glycosyltransferase n=1 Tax=Sporomusa ovata TaxID=2378 RepID=A0A0U1L5B4_9FIRM|nr:glycosyltransferase family 4 protein [Sporomusa ovata]EQB28546.1 glycosyltransferase [Sporomusa ovata DSM 2662]CQR74876.1 Glycosyltransferase [Sporomusa ovata]